METRKRRVEAVRAWFREEVERRKRVDREARGRNVFGYEYYGRPGMDGTIALGISSDGWGTLREGDSTPLARMFRHQGDVPLVRLTLPNAVTIGRHRIIRDAVLAEGGQVITVPRDVIGIADITKESIKVVHTRGREYKFFRADEQLIKANVRYYERKSSPWAAELYALRPTYFLSGYDANEPGLSYFFCELPPFEPGQEPTTVEQAYESLKPESVKIAEKLRRKVVRQGDMFFIRDKNFVPHESDKERGEAYLHRSNHVAEEVRQREGLTYVRGTISHRPPFREPDHKPLKLGTKYWWLCVRNTVPVTGN